MLEDKIKEEFKVIGRHKYAKLKSYDFDKMTTDQMVQFKKQHHISVAEAEKQIKKFEEKNNFGKGNITEKGLRYLKNLANPEPMLAPKKMTKDWLYKDFAKVFKSQNNTSFSINQESIENIKPLIYYFVGDFKNFKQCKNVSEISKPSLTKGLLIIGGYGNGKTTIMRALESCLKHSNVSFKGYTTNEVVTMYESCISPSEKAELNKNVLSGTRYFDDVLTERMASNYGKSNLLKDVIEERYNRKKRTYITCNYKDGTNNNLKEGLSQFGEKYGSRVYDRLFEMFNVIEFTGKSFRK